MSELSLLRESQLLLGNDIIDLRGVSKRARTLDDRYLHKIFTQPEILRIRKAPKPVTCLAAHWAIKEAAYKVWLKERGKRYFAPKHFEVHSFTKGWVSVPGGMYSFRLQTGSHWIHALCGKEITPSFAAVQILPLAGSKAEQSDSLRTAALTYVATHFSVPLESLELSRSPLNIPKIRSKAFKTSFDLTLSHDGGFGAFAIACR